MPADASRGQRASSKRLSGAGRPGAGQPSGQKGEPMASAAAAHAKSTAATAGPTNAQPRQEPNSLFLRVAASQGYPYVSDWFRGAAADMASQEAALRTSTVAALEHVELPKMHQRILRGRDTRGREKTLMLTKLTEVRTTIAHCERVGRAWRESFRVDGNAYLAELAQLENALLDRRAKAEEWTTTGVREQTLGQMERFEVKRAALAVRSSEEQAQELRTREREAARLRVAFESCVAEVRDVMGWYLQQPENSEEGAPPQDAIDTSGDNGGGGEGNRTVVTAADASRERRQRELLSITLPSILSAAAAAAGSPPPPPLSSDGDVPMDKRARSGAVAHALLAMLSAKYPDLVAAFTQAPASEPTAAAAAAAATTGNHAQATHVSPFRMKPSAELASSAAAAVERPEDQLQLIREEEALQAAIIRHVAGRPQRKDAALRTHEQLMTSARVFALPEPEEAASTNGTPGRRRAGQGKQGYGLSSRRDAPLESGASIARARHQQAGPHPSPTFVKLPRVRDAPHQPLSLASTMPPPSCPPLGSPLLRQHGGSRSNTEGAVCRDATRPRCARRAVTQTQTPPAAQGDTPTTNTIAIAITALAAEAAKTEEQQETDAVAARIAARLKKVQDSLVPATPPDEAQTLDEVPNSAAQSRPTSRQVHSTASRATTSASGRGVVSEARVGHDRRPRASPQPTRRDTAVPISPSNARPFSEASHERMPLRLGKGNNNNKNISSSLSAKASRTHRLDDAPDQLPAYFKTPLKASVIAAPPHPSAFAGHTTFTNPPPPLPPPVVVPADNPAAVVTTSTHPYLMDTTTMNGRSDNSNTSATVADKGIFAASSTDTSASLRRRLRALREEAAAVLAENVRLEQEKRRLMQNATSSLTAERALQGPKCIADRTAAAPWTTTPAAIVATAAPAPAGPASNCVDGGPTVSPAAAAAPEEQIDWFALSVAQQQREALDELHAALAQQQRLLAETREKSSALRQKIGQHEALMQSAQRFWRQNVAIMRNAQPVGEGDGAGGPFVPPAQEDGGHGAASPGDSHRLLLSVPVPPPLALAAGESGQGFSLSNSPLSPDSLPFAAATARHEPYPQPHSVLASATLAAALPQNSDLVAGNPSASPGSGLGATQGSAGVVSSLSSTGPGGALAVTDTDGGEEQRLSNTKVSGTLMTPKDSRSQQDVAARTGVVVNIEEPGANTAVPVTLLGLTHADEIAEFIGAILAGI